MVSIYAHFFQGNGQLSLFAWFITFQCFLKFVILLIFEPFSFAFRVETILNKVCFAEVGGCTLVICFLGYYLITVIKGNNTCTRRLINVIYYLHQL